MGFSTLFIRRPIATSLLMAGVMLLGIIGYRQLPVSALPDIDAPSIQVTTQYPGASPTTMASLVTTPLERQFGQISGLRLMTSDSSAGLSTILLSFDQDRDIDAASQDVQSAINAGRGTLPNNLPYPPVYNKVNPADAPILTLMMSSDALPLREVNNYADSILAQKLSQVAGVGLVSIAGNVRPAVRIQVDPAAIANQGLTIEDVRSALTQANVNGPKGTIDGASQSFTIGANDQLADADGYRNTIISYKGGAPVRLGDVAKVVDGVENDQLAAWANGKSAILLDIRRQPGANIVQTVDSIKKLLPEMRGLLPANVHLDVFADRTVTIRASVEDVEFTLLLTIGLVIAVIFVFLRRLWATVIPSVAVPLSLVGTFGLVAQFVQAAQQAQAKPDAPLADTQVAAQDARQHKDGRAVALAAARGLGPRAGGRFAGPGHGADGPVAIGVALGEAADHRVHRHAVGEVVEVGGLAALVQHIGRVQAKQAA